MEVRESLKYLLFHPFSWAKLFANAQVVERRILHIVGEALNIFALLYLHQTSRTCIITLHKVQ